MLYVCERSRDGGKKVWSARDGAEIIKVLSALPEAKAAGLDHSTDLETHILLARESRALFKVFTTKAAWEAVGYGVLPDDIERDLNALLTRHSEVLRRGLPMAGPA